jgi:ABC-type sugar transport system permease subunit
LQKGNIVVQQELSTKVVVAAPPRTQRKPLWQQIRRSWYLYALLLPTFAFLLVFTYYPALLALIVSFFTWDPGFRFEFVGLRNFQRVLTDPLFWQSWRNMGVIAIWTFTVPFLMPFLVAELIFNLRSSAAKQFYRVAILVPILIPGMVSVQLWKWLYRFPDGGINVFLQQVGLDGLMRPWLGDTATALPALLFMGFPWIVGTAPLIYLAGLMSISPETLDAAKIDGCNIWRRILYIDIPHVLGQVRLFLVFGIISLLQDFGSQLVLTKGGPYGATMVPAMYMYAKAFGVSRETAVNTQLGQAAAVGFILFVLIVIFTYFGQRYIRVSGIDTE